MNFKIKQNPRVKSYWLKLEFDEDEQYPAKYCYGNVLKYLFKHENELAKDALVIHGSVVDAEHHAWIEAAGFVIDPTIGYMIPISDYTEDFKAKRIKGFTIPFALAMTLRTNTTGPWNEEEIQALVKVEENIARRRNKNKVNPQNLQWLKGIGGDYVTTDGKWKLRKVKALKPHYRLFYENSRYTPTGHFIDAPIFWTAREGMNFVKGLE